MSASPFFTVITSTFNRGRHIEPTIQSGLSQTCRDFEWIVVGDGCTDDTEHVVRSFQSPHIVWTSLAANSGNQSAPNNHGLSLARGRWICYLGHDDLWAPQHLATVRAAIEAGREPDFVVAGCLLYGPEGSGTDLVSGLFTDSSAAFLHFFPTSSFAHRRDVVGRIGGWNKPAEIRRFVDVDFLLRAALAGLEFRSTGQVTVHKFAAGQRYLDYLEPGSAEQRAFLHEGQGFREDAVEQAVDRCRRNGRYMAMTYQPDNGDHPGHQFRQARRAKGLGPLPLQPLVGRVILEQTDEERGVDWFPVERAVRPFRWSGPNPRPKILLPFSGGVARLTMCLARDSPSVRDLSISVRGEVVDHHLVTDGSEVSVRFDVALEPSAPTVVWLHTRQMFCPHDVLKNGDRRQLGIAVSDIVIEPLPPGEVDL